MKLNPTERTELRRFATHLMQCAERGDVPDDTVAALNALAEAAPPTRRAANADDPAFLPPVPYFKQSTR